jgi:protein-S-isoprenylcysteine O-methyltransferase Ste14
VAISTRLRSAVAELVHTRAYDLAMRSPVLLWSTTLALALAGGLVHYIQNPGPALPSAVYSVNIVMRLSVIAYLAVLATTAVLRKQPIARSRGAEPRISAVIGTFVITAVVLFPRRELSLTAGLVSTFLILVGDALAVVALVQLRHSFSIMPEARELVTSGLYGLVRHPLYLAEAIATIGSVMQFLSVWTILLVFVQILFQLRRINNEEAILIKIFPVYATYQQRTARIIPRIY